MRTPPSACSSLPARIRIKSPEDAVLTQFDQCLFVMLEGFTLLTESLLSKFLSDAVRHITDELIHAGAQLMALPAAEPKCERLIRSHKVVYINQVGCRRMPGGFVLHSL